MYIIHVHVHAQRLACLVMFVFTFVPGAPQTTFKGAGEGGVVSLPEAAPTQTAPPAEGPGGSPVAQSNISDLETAMREAGLHDLSIYRPCLAVYIRRPMSTELPCCLA